MRLRAGGTRRLLAGLCTLALVAGAGACTGDGDDDPGGPARAGAGEVAGGVLRLAVGSQPELDPVVANPADPAALIVADLVHDGLTDVDAEGTVVPAVAASWSADPTFTTWQFVLATDAEFSDGSPVQPGDVIASLEHAARAGDTSLAATRLELITGYRAFVDGQAEHIAGLAAPDDSSLQIVLDAPLSTLPVLLSSPVYGIVDPDELDADEPRTTGPFQVSTSSDGLELIAREGAALAIGAVEVRAYDGPDAAYDAFDEGDADWALVPASRVGDAIDEHGDEAFRPFHAELFFGMNVANATLARPEVRQAIVLALDRQAIVDAVYADVADPLTSVVPAGVPGRDETVCVTLCLQDAARAQQLVAAAFPDGAVPAIGLDYDDSPDQRAMAGIVQQQLAAVGIPVELRPQPFEAYQRFVVSGAQQLFSFGWIGLYPSPDAYVSPLFRSTSPDNVTGFRSAEADAEIDAARAADATAGASHWARAEALALDAAVVVPIAQFRIQTVVADRVEGLEHRVDGTFDVAAVRLDR